MLTTKGPAMYHRLESGQQYAPADSSWGEPSPEWVSQRLQWIGQLNPYYEARHAMWHGRPLAGFGTVEHSGYMGRRPAVPAGSITHNSEPVSESTGRGEPTHPQFLKDIEQEDDVYGSGIFDQSGRRPTIHRNMGVFEDHPSLPGYIGREVQFAVSQEVSDITSGADVVVVPGGGMSYQERGGKIVQYDRFGPTPARPDYIPTPGPGPLTGKSYVYSFLDDQILQSRIARLRDTERAPTPGHIGLRASTVAQMQFDQGQKAAANHTVTTAEQTLTQEARRPVVPYDSTVRVMPDITPRPARPAEIPEMPQAAPPGSIGGFGAEPGGVYTQQIIDAPLWAVGIKRQPGYPVRVSPPPVPLHMGWPKSYGAAEAEEKKPLSWGAYAFGGLLVGAAAAMLMGATKMNERR